MINCKLKILIIGYGSIGKRHYEVLSLFSNVERIDLVTKQSIPNLKCFKSLEETDCLQEYDYFVIASETHKHFDQLAFLEEKVFNKIIFCEKPLFEKKKNLNIVNNYVFIGYVLRYHPLLDKLKSLLLKETVIYVNAQCGQYLPTWRQNIDYRESYSAKKQKGGGVLLDLSHEIDYVQWLTEKIIDIKSYQVKISDLEIDSDDLCLFIGKTKTGIVVNVSIDYISKSTHRILTVETLENTYKLDFIFNSLVKTNKQGLEESYSIKNLDRDYMFEKMHLDITTCRKNACTYKDGVYVMDTIDSIHEQNA